MPIETYRKLKRELAFIVFCFGMVILALGLVAYLFVDSKNATLANREIGKTNQYYTRVVACLASVNPTKRTPEYVKFCYGEAERATGISAEKYGDAEAN